MECEHSNQADGPLRFVFTPLIFGLPEIQCLKEGLQMLLSNTEWAFSTRPGSPLADELEIAPE